MEPSQDSSQTVDPLTVTDLLRNSQRLAPDLPARQTATEAPNYTNSHPEAGQAEAAKSSSQVGHSGLSEDSQVGATQSHEAVLLPQRFTLNDQESEKLVEQALRQVADGKRAGNSLKDHALTVICEAVREATTWARRRFITKESCANRLRALRSDWKMWKELKPLPAARVDPVTGAVTLPPFAMAKWLRTHQGKKTSKFFTQGPRFANECDMLFGGTNATGYDRSLMISNLIYASSEDESLGVSVEVDGAAARRRVVTTMDRAEKTAKRQRTEESREPVRLAATVQDPRLALLARCVFFAECTKSPSIKEKRRLVKNILDDDLMFDIFAGVGPEIHEQLVDHELKKMTRRNKRQRRTAPDRPSEVEAKEI